MHGARLPQGGRLVERARSRVGVGGALAADRLDPGALRADLGVLGAADAAWVGALVRGGWGWGEKGRMRGERGNGRTDAMHSPQNTHVVRLRRSTPRAFDVQIVRSLDSVGGAASWWPYRSKPWECNRLGQCPPFEWLGRGGRGGCRALALTHLPALLTMFPL